MATAENVDVVLVEVTKLSLDDFILFVINALNKFDISVTCWQNKLQVLVVDHVLDHSRKRASPHSVLALHDKGTFRQIQTKSGRSELKSGSPFILINLSH